MTSSSLLTANASQEPRTHPGDRTVIEVLQELVLLLEEQLRPLVQSELSVLVDVLHQPQLLFPSRPQAQAKCASFVSKLVQHTQRLLQEREEGLCVRVLQTLRQMMSDCEHSEKVRALYPPSVLCGRSGLPAFCCRFGFGSSSFFLFSCCTNRLSSLFPCAAAATCGPPG